MRESNSHQRFWRPLSYHLTNPLFYEEKVTITSHVSLKGFVPSKLHTCYILMESFFNLANIWKLHLTSSMERPSCLALRSSPHPISNSQLHASLHFHLCPIYLVVFKGVYFLSNGTSHLEGGFTLRCLQRLSLPDLATRP